MNSIKLQKELSKKKMSIYELSKKSGVAYSSCTCAVNGTRTNQPSSTILAFEKVLGLKKGELL